jgi:Adenylate and Guanylate cyclase catalytic domain
VGARRVEVVAVSRRVQTLLFTDIVGSTDRLRELGKRPRRHCWPATTASSGPYSRPMVAGNWTLQGMGSWLVSSLGSAVRAAVTALGIEIRAGLHTGEVELHRDQIAGVGVHLAARVMARAGPGQVLVSSTVRELLAGSGLRFVDLGVRELKGFAESWRPFSLDLATVPGCAAVGGARDR